MKPEILVTFFGGEAHADFLRRWVDHFQASGCRLPARILSDKDRPGFGLETLIVDPSRFSEVIRESRPFDYKGALILAALDAVPGPFLVVDCDAFIVGDVEPELEAVAGKCVAIAPDTFEGRTFEIYGRAVTEGCAGVLFFGGYVGGVLDFGYRYLWHKLAAIDGGKGFHARMREQRAWSALASGFLPETLNWSSKREENPAAKIIHHHGPK